MQRREIGLHPKSAEQDSRAPGEEIEILERAEHAHVDRDAKGQQPSPFPTHRLIFYGQRAEVVEARSEKQKEEEFPIPPRVKEVAGEQEKNVLRFEWEPVVDGQRDRQEDEEGKRVENHSRRVCAELTGRCLRRQQKQAVLFF